MLLTSNAMPTNAAEPCTCAAKLQSNRNGSEMLMFCKRSPPYQYCLCREPQSEVLLGRASLPVVAPHKASLVTSLGCKDTAVCRIARQRASHMPMLAEYKGTSPSIVRGAHAQTCSPMQRSATPLAAFEHLQACKRKSNKPVTYTVCTGPIVSSRDCRAGQPNPCACANTSASKRATSLMGMLQA